MVKHLRDFYPLPHSRLHYLQQPASTYQVTPPPLLCNPTQLIAWQKKLNDGKQSCSKILKHNQYQNFGDIVIEMEEDIEIDTIIDG